MISLNSLGVLSGNVSLSNARQNMRFFLEALDDDTSDNIAVDVKGPILLAPYDDGTTIYKVLDGEIIGNNVNRAIKCLTFDYGASLATHPDVPSLNDKISLKNVQIQADEKAFLFNSVNAIEAKEIIVTDLYNSEVSVCWFGAVADCGNTSNSIANATDNFEPFSVAINSFKNQSAGSFAWRNIVKIPAGLGNNNMYYFSAQLVIQSNVSLLGDGKVRSLLFFPETTGGLLLSEATDDTTTDKTSAARCTIENLTLFGPLYLNPNPEPTYNKSNGLTIRATCYISQVSVTHFDGNGIHISANVNANPKSNANRTQLYFVECTNNSINGILIDTSGLGSGDTNACLITSANVSRNGACGIRDQSFLGNTYVGCHSAANSNVVNNRSRVYHNGKNYICIQDNNDTITPGISTGWKNYWNEIGPAASAVSPYNQWVQNNPYVMSFGYALISTTNNNKSVIMGSYSENDQLPVFNAAFVNTVVTNTKSDNMIIGGTINKEVAPEIPGYLYNDRNKICSQNFQAKKKFDPALDTPEYSVISEATGDTFSSDQGAFRIYVEIKDEDNATRSRALNYTYLPSYKAFGMQMQVGAIAQMFSFRESLEFRNDFFRKSFYFRR